MEKFSGFLNRVLKSQNVSSLNELAGKELVMETMMKELQIAEVTPVTVELEEPTIDQVIRTAPKIEMEQSFRQKLFGKSAELGITEADVDPEELKLGIEIEMEHTPDPEIAKIIALDHLSEFDKYYSEGLIPMEKKLKKFQKKEEKKNEKTSEKKEEK